MERFRNRWRHHRNVALYFIFGCLTTLVNYLVYLFLYNIYGLSAGVSNAIAWLVSVLFAFLTNKPFVFQSHDWSMAAALPEFVGFIGTRFISGGVETAMIFACVDRLGWNGNAVKLTAAILVIVTNYAASKLLVFRR